jgi:hypothetical protein
MHDEEQTVMEVVQDARETWLNLLSTNNETKIREAKRFYIQALLQLLAVLNSTKP